MQIKINFFLIIFCSFFLFFSCDDAFLDTSVPPPVQENPDTMMTSPMSSSFMTAKVDGKDWEATAAGVLIQLNRIGISGQAAGGTVIVLSLEDMGEGEYPLTQEGLSAGAYTSNDGSNAFTSNGSSKEGVVNITELNWQDSTISGTFSFIGARAVPAGEVEIEEGKFENLPVRTELSSVNDFNQLMVKVDGEDFEPETVVASIDPFNNVLVITGTAKNGVPSVAIQFPQNITEGTYELGTPGFTDYGAQYNISDNQFLAAQSGELVITMHDFGVKTIEGTFSFEAAELAGEGKASLTEGSFQVTY